MNLSELKLLKQRSYIALGWGLIAMFAFLGALTGHAERSTFIATIASLMWVMFRIVREALDALMFLKAVREADKEAKEDDEL